MQCCAGALERVFLPFGWHGCSAARVHLSGRAYRECEFPYKSRILRGSGRTCTKPVKNHMICAFLRPLQGGKNQKKRAFTGRPSHKQTNKQTNKQTTNKQANNKQIYNITNTTNITTCWKGPKMGKYRSLWAHTQPKSAFSMLSSGSENLFQTSCTGFGPGLKHVPVAHVRKYTGSPPLLCKALNESLVRPSELPKLQSIGLHLRIIYTTCVPIS